MTFWQNVASVGLGEVMGIAGFAHAHTTLDEAVAAAYGWTWPMTEDELLEKLLALNLERAAAEETAVQQVRA